MLIRTGSLILTLCLWAFAANHYVRQGASGNGSDWTNAHGSLPSTLIRGDTYYVADGTYSSYTFDDAVSGTTPITIKKATVADHGTSTGWENTFGDGQAVFGSLAFTTSFWVVDGVTGGGPGSWKTGFGFRVDFGADAGVSVLGVTGITLRHIMLIGDHAPGSGGEATTDAFYFRNQVGSNGDFTVSYFYTDSVGLAPFSAIPIASVVGSNFLAEYGYIGAFYATDAAHAEVASIWGGINGTVTFRYNVFAYVTSTGGLMFDNIDNHNARMDVYGNVFFYDTRIPDNNNCCNGWVGGWTSNSNFYNTHVFNNTFIDISGNGQALSTFPQTSGNNEARNNLFYNVERAGGGSGVWQTVTHNHFISSTPVGTNTSTGSGDPFVGYLSNDFRLKAATTAGTNLSAPYNVDMYGNVRGADGTWDRGAVEFNASPSVNPALFSVSHEMNASSYTIYNLKGQKLVTVPEKSFQAWSTQKNHKTGVYFVVSGPGGKQNIKKVLKMDFSRASLIQ